MALTANRNTPAFLPSPLRSYPVAASTKIYAGSLVALNSSGYLVPGSVATTLTAVGRANALVDNTTGGNGALYCEVEQGTFAWVNHSSLTLSAVGDLVYIYDDESVTSSASGTSIAGTVAKVDSAGVWVSMGIIGPLDASVTTDFITSLASTSTGQGAALVGIEDAGSLFAGTTVEAALQEKITGARVKVLADAALTPGVLCVQTFAIADAASGNTSYTLALKQEIIGVTVQKRSTAGGSGDTITVGAGASAITNAIDINVADKTVVNVTTIDDANSTIASGGSLRITWAKSTNVACLVTVYSVLRT